MIEEQLTDDTLLIRDEPNQSPNVLPPSPSESAGSSSSFPFQLAFKYQEIADGLNCIAQHANEKEEQQPVRNQLSQPKPTGSVAQQLHNTVFRLSLWATDVSIRSPTRTESTAAVLQKLEDANWPKAEILNTVFENILTCLQRLVAIPEIGLINKKNGEQENPHKVIGDLRMHLRELNELSEAIRTQYALIVDGHSSSTLPGCLLLCLDGGGVRSYSSLLILKRLMETVESIQQNRKWASDFCPPESKRPARPRDYFDFVFGSSSGGLIAIMLGRLKMTVDECMEAFKDYGDDVFRHPRVTHLRNELGLGWLFGLRRSKYGHKSSITAIQKAVQDSEPDSGAWKHTTFAALEDHCKTGVIAYGGSNSGLLPHIFRTYDHPDAKSVTGRLQSSGYADTIPVWLVARATSAAPIYFDSVDINGQNFVDGGFGCNNPSVEAIFEVRQIYRQNSKNKRQSQHKDDEEIENPIDLLLSIGSGTRQPRQFPIGKGLRRTSYWLREVSRKISDTESTHALVQEMYKTMHTPSSYYRYNVGEGVGHVPLDEWKITGRIGKEKTNKTLAYIEAETFKYLDQAEVQASVLSCAQKLVRLRRWRN